MTPFGSNFDRTLVIIDMSWWLNKAFHGFGIGGMASSVIGWLVHLLSDPCPAAVAVALDSVGPTWRHRRTADLDPAARYKAGREPKPPEYRAVCNRILDVVEQHQIPTLVAEGWEADDAIAAAVPLGIAEGYQVVILAADKDFAALTGPHCAVWDGASEPRGEAEMRERWGVAPSQMRELLAIMGDAADNVPGCKGLGKEKASLIVQAFGSVEAALAAAPAPPSNAEIKAAEKAVKKAKAAGGGDALCYAEEDLARLRRARSLSSWVAMLQAQREQVLLSRELVTLDPAAPIVWEPERLPVGWDESDARAIAREYAALGFSALAREVRACPKQRYQPQKAA